MPCKWIDVCPLRRFEREGKLSLKWKKDYCQSNMNWKNCKRYQAEEGGKKHPNNMLPNGEIDEKLK